MQKTARPQTCFCPRIHEAISEEKPSPVLTQISTEPQNHRFESQLPFSPASLGNPNHSPQPDPKAAPIRPQFFLAFQVLRRASGVAPRSWGKNRTTPCGLHQNGKLSLEKGHLCKCGDMSCKFCLGESYHRNTISPAHTNGMGLSDICGKLAGSSMLCASAVRSAVIDRE